jgi:D-sedoheptulose 7-phosphate isomerase
MTMEQDNYGEAARRVFEEQRQAMDQVVATQIDTIAAMAEVMVRCYRAGHQAVWCGNGGSAADAQHLAAELVGRYLIDRPPLRSLALHTDTSVITAIGNDFGYDQIFARQAEAHLVAGDVLVCLSTSGRSPNVVAAAHVAREKGCAVLGLLGRDGGDLLPLCDHALVVPVKASYIIQQVSMIVGHYLCDQVEQALFGPGARTAQAAGTAAQ